MRYVTTDFGGYEDENWNPVPKESGIYQGTAYAVRCYVDWCNTESDLLTGKVFVEYTDTHNVTVRLDYFESPKKKRPEVQMESKTLHLNSDMQFGGCGSTEFCLEFFGPNQEEVVGDYISNDFYVAFGAVRQ